MVVPASIALDQSKRTLYHCTIYAISSPHRASVSCVQLLLHGSGHQLTLACHASVDFVPNQSSDVCWRVEDLSIDVYRMSLTEMPGYAQYFRMYVRGFRHIVTVIEFSHSFRFDVDYFL